MQGKELYTSINSEVLQFNQILLCRAINTVKSNYAEHSLCVGVVMAIQDNGMKLRYAVLIKRKGRALYS